MTDGKKSDRQNRMSERFSNSSARSESQESDTTDTNDSLNDDNDLNDVNEEKDVTEVDDDTQSGRGTTSSTSSSPAADSSTSTGAKTVRETKARTFYLGTDRLKRLDRLYKEMSLEYEIEFEEDLPKNDAFYGAMIDAVCNRTTIEEELGLTESADEDDNDA